MPTELGDRNTQTILEGKKFEFYALTGGGETKSFGFPKLPSASAP